MERKVRRIQPLAPKLPTRKRVAAYARVSSGKDEMLHSLAAQVSYYSEMIRKRPGWEYAGVYADEAVAGTKDTREQFQMMLEECRTGMIDMVITKSISRFARNTVTMLETVRELKNLNIDVFFEKENIHSLSGDGELMLTILASFAQEESRSVSENVKWRIRKRFQNGELANLQFMYGYRIRKGRIEIDPAQADIVHRIFREYISGIGSTTIARRLRDEGVKSIRGGAWTAHRINGILKNEKYPGNALLQKKYTVDHLSKKLVLNHGALPRYLVECTHPAIVDLETFQQVQAILVDQKVRNEGSGGPTSRYPFSGKLICGNCGKSYLRKTWRGHVFWQCSTYFQYGKAACPAKRISEEILLHISPEVLGFAVMDENEFQEKIREIRVTGPNMLEYVLSDGSIVRKEWQDRSRKDSWDEQARQQARECKIEGLRRSRKA